MPVRFTNQGTTQELIPAPFVSVSKIYIRDNNGAVLYPEYTFTLNGSIVSVGSALNSPGGLSGSTPLYTFGSMEGILAEQQRIRELFATDGGRLEIESPGGGGPNTIDAYCSVESINFAESTWTTKCEYTISLKAKGLAADVDDLDGVMNMAETWSITEQENNIFSVEHNLSCVGVLLYSDDGANDPLESARLWCRNRMYSIDSEGQLSPRYSGSSVMGGDTVSFDSLLSKLSGDGSDCWNYGVVESIDPTTYTYEVKETFIHLTDGVYERWNASVTTDENNLVTIELTGDITGHASNVITEDLESTDTGIIRANAKWAEVSSLLYNRMLPYVPDGYTLNPSPITHQVTRNITDGVLSYSRTYRAHTGRLIDGAIEENIGITDVGASDVFVEIPIPGRANGPLIQYMQTQTSSRRVLNITAKLLPTSIDSLSALVSAYNDKPDVDDIILALTPDSSKYYVQDNSEEWNPTNGQFTRSVTWVRNSTPSGTLDSNNINQV